MMSTNGTQFLARAALREFLKRYSKNPDISNWVNGLVQHLADAAANVGERRSRSQRACSRKTATTPGASPAIRPRCGGPSSRARR